MARARTRILQSNWTSGEISPELAGRTDQKRYYDAAVELSNFQLRPLGGVTRRPGTTYVTGAKASTETVQLVPFVARADTAYVVEFGDVGGTGYARFFRNNGQIQAAGEVQINGQFASSLTGWTTSVGGGTSTVTWSSGYGGSAKLLSPQSYRAALRQNIAVVAGAQYQVSLQIPAVVYTDLGVLPSTAPTFGLGSVASMTELTPMDLLQVSLTASGTYRYTVTATTTTLSLLFVLPGVSQVYPSRTLFVDNVVVERVGAYEIASPYVAGDLRKLRWAPSADVLYLACEGYAPRKLSRASDTSWALTTVSFNPPPTEEPSLTFAGVSLTLSAATVGAGRTVTASGSIFLNGDLNRYIKSGTGRAIITGYTSATQMTVTNLDPFEDTSVAAGTWTLEGSPNDTLTPDTAVTGAWVTLTASSLNVFRAADVGKHVVIAGGLVRLGLYTSGTVASGTILRGLNATTGTKNWTLESASWNTTDGYPSDVAFTSGDRLAWGRNDRVWLSCVGDYENFSPGTTDDAAISLALRTAEVTDIRGIIGATELQLFTSGGEFVVTGSSEGPLTPTDFRITSDTNFGAGRVRVLRVNGQSLFVDRSSRGLREQVFDFAVNRFVAVDLLQLAQHLFPVGQTIVELAYQRPPASVVLALRSDGVLCALTYLRAEQVVGWWRMVMDGFIESVAVIPHPDGDREQVWLAVRRVVNGAEVRYIERVDDTSLFTDADDGLTWGQKLTDSTLSYQGAALATVSGLSHLEGCTVWALGDGAFLGSFTVASGSVTLPGSYSAIEVGLPYTATLTTMRPEVQVEGTSQGVRKRHARVLARLYRTGSLKFRGVGATLQPFKIPAGSLYTGDAHETNLGWDRDGQLTFVSDEPLPVTILMLSSVLGIGV